ncbi:MAG: carbon-phosphorus lyase complex subunit PhnI [Oceanidesulfovibrio sp.]
MAYVAIQGGEKAIDEAARLNEFLRTRQGASGSPLGVEDIKHQLCQLTSRIMSESGLHHPDLAALALKQCLGDPLEASFALRAYRSTKQRTRETSPHDTSAMRVIRRISAAFRDVPGGQMLGPTTDYSLRLLRLDLMDESDEAFQETARAWLDDLPEDEAATFPKVLGMLRERGLLAAAEASDETPLDVTREPLVFPAPRSAALQVMARAETGSLLMLAYSNMRGFGEVHPAVGELRVGYLPVALPHPVTGEPVEAGEVLMTECEIVAMFEAAEDAEPMFTVGYGACFGHNETKAISMAVLDRALQQGRSRPPMHPSEDEEFVLLHVDGVDSMGFCNHYKMPHYVTFQSDMDRLETAQVKSRAARIARKRETEHSG